MDETGKPQTAVTWVRKNSKHTGSKKTVLIMLADFIDDGNNCPSQKELATAAGLSVDTIRRCLGELVKDKTITVKKSGGKKVKGGQCDCYAINRDAPGTETTPQPATTPLDTTRMEQPGSPIPPSTQQPGSNAEDAPVYVSDAATHAAGEKDLSGNANLTTKTPPLPPKPPEGNAPDGAGVAASKPKRERPKPVEPPKDDVYHRLLKGVCLRSWGFNPDDGDVDKDTYKRIGLIVSWLRGKNVLPEMLSEFYVWYRQEYEGAKAPRDLVKFKEHYAAFEQSKSPALRNLLRPVNPAYVEIKDRPRLRADEVVNLDIARKAVPS